MLQALDWDEADIGPACGLTYRSCVSRIVFLALLHKRLDRLGRDQLHLVSKADQHAGPVMRRTARLHDDRAGLLLLEEHDQFAPAQLAPDRGRSGLVYSVDLEDGFRGIQADHGNARRGRLLLCRSP